MANVEYVTHNKLTEEADNQKRSSQKLIGILGVSLAVVALFFHYYISIFILVGTLFVWASQNGSETLRAGAVGEDIALDVLKKLPDSFTIYNQVDIPNEKSRTGFNEADLIVVGPSAIFVVEVKHNNGHITGSDSDKEWGVRKVGRGGTAYSKTMRSPVSQVKKLVWLLSEDLKKNHSRAWVQGVVLFSNRDAEVSVTNSSNVPVLRNQDIVDYIQSYKAKSTISNIGKVTNNIAKLKAA